MTDVETNLWSFSLRAYSAPGVAERCIWLQDNRGLDVNVLLFCVWSGLGRAELEASLMVEADRLSREWSSRVVWGLRAARRELAETGHEELRAEVQRAELAAEKIEQEQLEQLVRGRPVLESTPAVALARARHNLELYLDTVGVALDPEVDARLRHLLVAGPPGRSETP